MLQSNKSLDILFSFTVMPEIVYIVSKRIESFLPKKKRKWFILILCMQCIGTQPVCLLKRSAEYNN